MDTSWYLDVNRFARSTAWAHGFMHAYALWAGVVVLGLLLVAGWWQARSEGTEAVARMLWAGAGTLAAVGLNQPLSHLVGRARPYDVLRGVEVLVPRAHDFSFPSDHTTATGAVICGLVLAGRRALTAVAVGTGLLLAFARVYVGAHYPGDVVGGLIFGALVVGALAPVALWILRPVVARLAGSPLRLLVATGTLTGAGGAGEIGAAGPTPVPVPAETASASATSAGGHPPSVAPRTPCTDGDSRAPAS